MGVGPDDPPVVVFFNTDRRGEDNLQFGDRLLSVGEVDLRGASQLQYQVAMAEQIRYGKVAAVQAERNGQIVTEYIKTASGKVPWSHIPFVTGFAIIALIVLLRVPEMTASRLFFAAFMTTAIFQTSIGDGSAFQLILANWVFHVFGVISITLNVLFVISFPRPDVGKDKRRIANWVAFIPPTLWLIPRADYYFTGLIPAENFTTFTFATDVFFLATIVVVLSWNYYCVDAASRRKVRWALFGVYIAILPNIALHAIGSLMPSVDIQWFHAISAFFYVAIPVSIWISIAHFDLFDVDRAICDTVSYTVLVVLLALVAKALFEPLAASLAIKIGFAADAGQLIFVGLLAALAIPMQKMLRPYVEMFFLPHHHTLNEAIESLIDKISDSSGANLDDLTALIGASIDESLKPGFCALYLRDLPDQDIWQATYCSGLQPPPGFTREQSEEMAIFFQNRVLPLRIRVNSDDHTDIHKIFRNLQVSLVVPFHFENKCKALLILSDKISRDVYTTTDISLLTAVAMQASLSYSKAV